MRLLLGLIPIIAIAGCEKMHDSITTKIHISDSAKIRGTGEPVSKEFTVSRFEKIRSSAAMHFVITEGKDTKVTIAAQKEILDSLTPKIVNGELSIETPESYSSDREVLVTIQTPSLTYLTSSGASKVDATGDWTGDLTLVASGGSAATVTSKSKSLNVEAQGAARVSYSGPALSSTKLSGSGGSETKISPKIDIQNIKLTGGSKLALTTISGQSGTWALDGGSELSIDGGSFDEVTLNANGASRLRANKVWFQKAAVSLNGAASAEMAVRDRVAGDVSGASELRCGDVANNQVKTSGAGRVVR